MSTLGFIVIALSGVALAHSAATNALHDKIKVAKATCTEKGGNSEEFKKLWAEHKVPETEQGKCFLSCIMKEMGILNEGKFDMEKMLADVPDKWSDEESREKAKKIYPECIKALTEGKNDCELAADFASCFVTESEKVGLMAPGHTD